MSEIVDRSRFRATSLDVQKQKEEEVKTLIGDTGGGYTKTVYHEIEEGVNKFRLYFGHPDVEDSTTLETKVVSFVPYMKVEKNDDGEDIIDAKTGKPKLKRTTKPIFNSKVHGGLPYSLTETFIELAKKNADLLYPDKADAEAKKQYLEAVVGSEYKPNTKPAHQGILPKMSWVCYADKLVGKTKDADGNEVDKFLFGRLEIKKSVKNGINKISAIESVNDAYGSDACFTDVDNGRLLVVLYDKSLKANEMYNVSIDSQKVTVKLENGVPAKIDKVYPLTDDQINNFLEAPKLTDMRTAYTRKDFNNELEGLRMLDNENDLGVFDTDEFKDVVNKIDSLLPEEEEDLENTSNDVQSNNTSNTADKFDLMDKAELRAFNKTEGCGIKFLITDSEEVMRNALREWERQEFGEDTETEPTPEVQEEQKEVEQPKQEVVETKPVNRLEELRKKKAAQQTA